VTISWTKAQRERAKHSGSPLVYLAVDGWHLEGKRKQGKLELSGPFNGRDADIIREFIVQLSRTGNSIDTCFQDAVNKVDKEAAE
jgi:hypothetical protein